VRLPTSDPDGLEDLWLLSENGAKVVWPKVCTSAEGRHGETEGHPKEHVQRSTTGSCDEIRNHRREGSSNDIAAVMASEEVPDAAVLEDLQMLHAAGIPVVWPNSAAARKDKK